MSKIPSTEAKLYIETAAVQVGTVITAATKASPAVITFATLPIEFVEGLIVEVTGTGWKSLDDKAFQIGTVAGDTITLHDSDTSAEVPDVLLGTVTEVEFVEWCAATVDIQEPAGTDIDTTTMCDTERTTVAGLGAIATWAATGFWDDDDAAQARVRAVRRSRENVTFVARWTDNSGLVWVGSVKNIGTTAGVDQAVTMTWGGNVSGGVRYLDKDTALVIES